MSSTRLKTSTQRLPSLHLKREVHLSIWIPQNLAGNERLNLLLLNDGQDAVKLKLSDTLDALNEKHAMAAVMVVAIHASTERLQEYGVAGHPDYQKRGAKADLYTAFILEELLPWLQEMAPQPVNGNRVMAGFSMGGLSAFDVVWNNPQVFDAVGVFSGSFWWRKKDLNAGYTETDRIMHQVIADTAAKPDLKFWIMTGTKDETADRNQNYIIDSIDDAIDLIKELMKKGYRRPDDITYYERVGGKHDIDTWAKVLPAFLLWAFPLKVQL